MGNPMKYLSLFSGIEAATAAWEPLGWECKGFSEILPQQSQFLAAKYPNVKNYGDVTKISDRDIKEIGEVDVVVFGSPCQGLSVAGKRGGFNGNASSSNTNSALFFHGLRVARATGARFILWENVFGALCCSKGKDFARVVGEMAGIDGLEPPDQGWQNEGAAVGSFGLCEWSVLDSQFFGVAQRRRRLFTLLDTGDWQSRRPILLEPRTMRGNVKEGTGKGQDIAEGIREGFAYGIPGNWIGRAPKNGGNATTPMTNLSPNLTRTDRHAVSFKHNEKYIVRRFTRNEVETLQGFDRGYLDLMICPEDKKIEALGRSMAVPVMQWIGNSIQNAIK